MATPLTPQFRSDGFDFGLLRREGAVALLAKRKHHHRRPNFEVVLIQIRPAERIFGRDLPEREVMPPSESWGTLGWSYADIAGAEARFNRVCEAQRKGHSSPRGFAPSASAGSRRHTTSANAPDAPLLP